MGGTNIVIPMFKVAMSDEAPRMVKKTLRSGMIGEGDRVKEFKEKLEKRFKCKNLVLLNSCTSALTLALRLADVRGGEVISSPFTMIATNDAIKAAGGKIVFADINKDNVNISATDIKKKITPKTRAVVVTYVGGVPCDMKKIMTFGIPVIADAAHAIDTYYHRRHISYWADFTCFSFQSIKQLTTGDGGALVVKDDYDYERANKLKWFGMTRKVPQGMTRLEHQMTADVREWGYKFHMNDIAASIGLANFKLLDDITKKQNYNAAYYRRHLKGLPSIPIDCTPSWWGFYVFSDNREEFIEKMRLAKIETTPMWRRNDKYTAFKTKADLPNMDRLEKKIVFIPVGWWLTREGLVYIANEANFYNHLS